MTQPNSAADVETGLQDSGRRSFGRMLAMGAATVSTQGAPEAASGDRMVRLGSLSEASDAAAQNTEALARAFSALRDGQTLVLPGGVVRVGTHAWEGLSLQRLRRVRIVGNGTTLIWTERPRQVAAAFGPTALRLRGCQNVIVEDLCLDGNGLDCIGIGLEDCSGCTIATVEAYGHGSETVTGLGQFVSCRGRSNRWVDCTARDSTRGSQYRGFYLGNSNSGWGEHDLRIEGCRAERNDATGFAISAIGLHCSASLSAGNAGAGFTSSTAPGSGSADHIFSGNVARENGFHGWQTDVYGPNVERVVLTGNQFSGNRHCGVFCHKAVNVSVTGNLISDNGADTGAAGIQISSSTGVAVTANTIRTAGPQGSCVSTAVENSAVADLAISGNNCVAAASIALRIEARESGASVRRVSVTGNVVAGSPHGLHIGASAAGASVEDVVISNNVLRGDGAEGIAFVDFGKRQSTRVSFIGNVGTERLRVVNAHAQASIGNAWDGLPRDAAQTR